MDIFGVESPTNKKLSLPQIKKKTLAQRLQHGAGSNIFWRRILLLQGGPKKQIITRVSYNSTSIVVKEPQLPTYNKAIYRGYSPTYN